MIDKKETFTKIRKEFGKLNQKQVEGFDAIFDAWDNSSFTDVRWLAYMLSTDWHETDKTMQPIEEYGKGRLRPYGKRVKFARDKRGNRIPYTDTTNIFYGRGKVQLTWYENYKLMGEILGLDLINHPELALQLDIAVLIMFEGMTKSESSFGDFTGKSLENYFNATINDPIGARRIINGTDCNELIASYHNKFMNCIVLMPSILT